MKEINWNDKDTCPHRQHFYNQLATAKWIEDMKWNETNSDGRLFNEAIKGIKRAFLMILIHEIATERMKEGEDECVWAKAKVIHLVYRSTAEIECGKHSFAVVNIKII